MIARITLILTMLLSTAHSPFCRCSAATDEETSDVAGQSHECSHCNEQEPGSVPCPVRPDCCCRAGRMLILADLQDSEPARDLHPAGDDFFNAHCGALRSACHLNDVTVTVAENPETDSGGRAHLMRTCRLLL